MSALNITIVIHWTQGIGYICHGMSRMSILFAASSPEWLKKHDYESMRNHVH